MSADVQDDLLARRNALALAAAQALFGSCTTALVVTAGLIGTQLSPDPFWATLPQSTVIVGTALSTFPQSMLMRRIGRRAGFMGASLVGALGAAIGTYAIYQRSFGFFLLACLLIGLYQASASYYRFAAADVASPQFRPKAISWVLTGGVIAAIFGSLIVIWTVDLLAPVTFAGTWVAMIILALLATLVLSQITIPKPTIAASDSGRPLAEIALQRPFVTATAVNLIAYGAMMLVMTATPVAMLGCGFTVQESSWVIQWHALAMFAPSFITGTLVARFGAAKIAAAGMIFLWLAGANGLLGLQFGHFALDLICLGLGWNFAYVGGSTMLTATYHPEERNKAQGLSDFLVFTATALASLGAGAVMAKLGWSSINLALFPLVAIGLALLLFQQRSKDIITSS